MSAKAYENLLLTILFVTFGFVFFDRLAVAYLFPYIARDLALDASHLGLLAAALAITWAISGWIFGIVSDRSGSRKPILIGAVVAFSLSSFLSGAASSFGQLLAIRLFMGAMEGPVLPLAQSLLLSASSDERRGLNMGLLQSSASGLFGVMLAPVILNWLASHYGWRTAFYVSCVPGLLLALLILLLVREPKREPPPVQPAVSEAKPRRDPIPRNIWLCMAISCCFVTWFMMITIFAPAYLLVTRQFSVEAQSAVLTVAGVAYVIWGFAVPAISDRIGRRPPLILFGALSALTPLMLVYIGSPVVMAAAIALTFFGTGCMPLFMATVPAESVGPGRMAASIGLVMGVGEVVGGCLMPYLAGIAAVRYGPGTPFLIAAVAAVIGAALAWFLRETAPSQVAGSLRERPSANKVVIR